MLTWIHWPIWAVALIIFQVSFSFFSPENSFYIRNHNLQPLSSQIVRTGLGMCIYSYCNREASSLLSFWISASGPSICVCIFKCSGDGIKELSNLKKEALMFDTQVHFVDEDE